MNFESFQKKNHFRPVECECCTFCKWFVSDSYDFSGKCSHDDISEKEKFWASVNDFNICDKFEMR